MNTRTKPVCLTEVAACLYEAGTNAEYWQEAAIQVGRYTQSCTTNLMWLERSGRKVIWYTDGLLQDTHGPYFTRLYKADPAYRYALTAPLDTPGVSDDFALEEGCDHAEVQELLLRNGITARARIVVLRTARHISFVGLGRRQRPFDRNALRRIQEVSPHMRRAIQVAYRLKSAEQSARPLMEVMDRLEHGVFLVDQNSRITYINAEGNRILRDSGVLSIRQRILNADAPAESMALNRLLNGAIQTAKGEGKESGGWLTLHDALGNICLYLDITPLRTVAATSDKVGSSPRAMIVARMPDTTVALRPETLREHFRLSPAEARLAVDLAQGDPLKNIAERRGVTFGTVRAQLASIFDKTGVHRQSELVRLLMGVSGGLVERPRSSNVRRIGIADSQKMQPAILLANTESPEAPASTLTRTGSDA